MATKLVAFATTAVTCLVVVAAADIANASFSSAHSATDSSTSRFVVEFEKAIGYADDLTKTELSSAIALSRVTSPGETLLNAKVDDRTGLVIGPVRSVVEGDEVPVALHVEVGGWLGIDARVVSIDAGNFTYLPTRNILLAHMSKTQIEKLSTTEIISVKASNSFPIDSTATISRAFACQRRNDS